MKILIITSLFLFFSCGETVTINKEEYNKLKGVKPSEYPKDITIDGYPWEITLGSDGHEYCDNNASNSYVCFHYIDCKLCEKRKNETKNHH